MSRRLPPVLAWGLCGVDLVAVGLAVALGAADDGVVAVVPGAAPHTSQFSVVGSLLAVVVAMAFALAGAVIAARIPGNPIGWLLAGIGALVSVDFLAEAAFWHLAARGEQDRTMGTLAGWYQNWFWVPVVVMGFSLLPLLFPTGAPPSPRWRPVGWLAVAAGAVVTFDGMFSTGQLENVDWDQQNPYGLVAWPQPVPDLAMALWGVSVLLAVASVVVRFRRSRDVEREQLKWFVLAISLAVVLYLLNIPFGRWGAVLLSAAALSVVGAVAVAVLRYRLYDVDLVINRALVYGCLTVALAASYLAVVLVLLAVLHPLTSSSQLAVATSTLVVAALFRPARARIQAGVDRRFFRSRYDAGRTLSAFNARVRDEVELEAFAGELAAVVSSTLHPTHVAVWLRGGP